MRRQKHSQYVPWGTRHTGHDADGTTNTYQIPFYKSFNWWYILVHAQAVIVGNGIAKHGLNFTRTLISTWLHSVQFLTLVNVTNTAGLLYQVTLYTRSTDNNNLEACMRAKIDSDNISL